MGSGEVEYMQSVALEKPGERYEYKKELERQDC